MSKTIEQKIESLLKEKHTGTSSDGVLIYKNLNSKDIQKIIAEVSLDLVNKIDEVFNNSKNENEATNLTDEFLREVKEKYSPTPKSKLKIR